MSNSQPPPSAPPVAHTTERSPSRTSTKSARSVPSTKSAHTAHSHTPHETLTKTALTADPEKEGKREASGKMRKTGPSGAYVELPRWRFWAVMVSLMISIFLFALDQLIIATAIPKITSEFNALSQLSWLANGFL